MSIQKMIDQAKPGEIIYIKEGTYTEELTVDKDQRRIFHSHFGFYYHLEWYRYPSMETNRKCQYEGVRQQRARKV